MSVVFTDAVTTIRTHLISVFPTLDVYSRIPNGRTRNQDEFVTLRRVGGVNRNLVTDEPTIAVEAWSTSPTAAHDLIQNVRAAIHDMPTTVPGVYRVTEFAGPADLPDPESTQHRFTYTVAVALRGADSVTLNP